MGLNRLMFVLFALLLAVQTGVVYTIVSLEKSAAEVHDRLTHAHEVIHQSEVYIKHLIDAETGQRGFLLTGQQSYLEPYYTGVVSAKSDITTLRELTADEPAQQHRLDAIEILMHEKFDELQQTINLQQDNRKEEAFAIVGSNRGKDVMDEIRKITNELVHDEKHLLAMYEKASSEKQSILQQVFIAAALLLIGITLVIAIIFRFRVINPVLSLTDEIRNKTLDDSSFNEAIATADEVRRLKLVFREMYEQIAQKTIELRKLSLTDPLTGLDNRRSFNKRVDSNRLHCIRYKRPLSVMMMDVDLFKSINDTYGHERGDDALKMAAVLIRNELREVDVLARLGGDEFAAALPETPLDEAVNVAERIREGVGKIKVETESGLLGITVSVGVAEMTDAEESVDDLLKTADQLLYEAKQKGRNKVEKQV